MNNQNTKRDIGLSPCATPVRPQTQVEGMTDTLRDSIDYLAKSVEELAEKIAPVLRGDAPTADCGKPGPPEEMLVPVADRMREFNKRIVAIRERVQSLTERTEA
jgi:hypothetical protein